MKICFFIPKIENCGPVNVVLHLLKEFSRHNDMEITLITIRNNLDSQIDIDNLNIKEVFSLENLSLYRKNKKIKFFE